MKKGIETDSVLSSSTFEHNSSKKGQVTVFIIVGIFVLLTFAGILYLTKINTTRQITTQADPIIAAVPQELKPIQSYTENCLSQVGKRGLLILGGQGGYIYPELVGEYSTDNPTDAAGLDLEPAKVPYWHYNSKPNSAKSIGISTLQPALHSAQDPYLSIEAQLARYITEQLDSCLQNYTVFSQYGYDLTPDSERKKVDVHVAEETVNVLLNMPLQVRKEAVDGRFDQFYVKIPLKLKHYYELASAVTQAQKNVSFLERQTLDIIASFSGLNYNDLPPMEMLTFDKASTHFWTVASVRNNLISLLSSYVPMLQVYSAHNLVYEQYPTSTLQDLYQQNYNNLIIPIMGAGDVEVRFDYFGWHPYFRTNDHEGLIKPQEYFISQWFVNLAQQRYYTVYDLSYPVVVSIDDPLAFDGEGYQLSFALEANIRNNDIATENKTLPPDSVSFSESLACEVEHRDIGPLRTVVVDSYTQELIDSVRVGFKIPDVDQCDIGFTNAQGSVEGKYPSASGGLVSYVKEGYLVSYLPLETYALGNNPAFIGQAVAGFEHPVVELQKFKKVNVTVKKSPLQKCLTPLECDYTVGISGPADLMYWTIPFPYKDISCYKGKPQCYQNKNKVNQFINNPAKNAASFLGMDALEMQQPLGRVVADNSLSMYNDYYPSNYKEPLGVDEEAVFTLTRIDDDMEMRSKEETISIRVIGEEKFEADLVPGKYKVEGLLTKHKKITIPKDDRSFRFEVLNAEEELKYTLNESIAENRLAGRISWDTSTTYLEITPDQLYNSKNLELYLPSQDLEKIPAKTYTFVRACTGYLCTHLGEGDETTGAATASSQTPMPGLSSNPTERCFFESCAAPTTRQISAIVAEDLQLVGQMSDISKQMRGSLEPTWKK